MKAAKRIGRGVVPAEGAYFWRSAGEVLFVRPGVAESTFRITRLPVGSGKEQPLPALNQRLEGRLRGTRVRIASPSHPEGEEQFLPPTVSVSPDGKWLLWYGGLQWTALSLEGTDELHWRQPSPLQNPAAWMPDGRHWVELEADAREGRDFLRRVFVHDLQNPLADRTIETPALQAGSVLGFTPEGRLLVRHPSPLAPAEEAMFTEVDLSSEQGVLRAYTLRLPKPGTVVETVLSPEGDRLVWVLTEAGEPARRSVWLSRPGGEGMALVGTAPETLRPQNLPGADDGLQLVRWLPQGEGLSFVAGGSLYTLALPR